MKLSALRASCAVLLAVLMLAAGTARAAPEDEVQEINPRYLLVDSRGRAISNEDFPGRYQLISFGYTYCPDICPTTLASMAQVLKHLGDKAAKLQPIFISVDPERDTKEVLAKYTAYFDERIIGLTGAPQLVRGVADHYKVVYRKYLPPGAPPDGYSIDHSAGMYLLGPDGQFAARFAHGEAPRAIAQRITRLMAGTADTAR